MIFNTINTSKTTKNSVILVGEVLIDVIYNLRKRSNIQIVGGSPFNICKNLTKLNINNIFYGAIGNDKFGTIIQEEIQKQNIKAHLNITNKQTSFVEINQTSSSPIPIFHRGSDNFIHLSDNLITDVENSKILHFTYWPLSKDPSLSTLLALVKKAKTTKTLIGFDPNYHPLLDDKNLSGFKLIREIIKEVDIIKPSIDDSIRLFGKRTIEQYLSIYEDLGAKIIIMTLGKDGLIARFDHKTVRMPSLATEVIDSTGAGDAFWSGFYGGIIKNLTIEQSLKLGLLCSAENLRTVGSDLDLPEIDSLIEKAGI